jgi:hypothetical protein
MQQQFQRRQGKPILSGHQQVVTNITQNMAPDDEFNFIKKKKES